MKLLQGKELSTNIFPGFAMAVINLPMSIGFAFLAGIPPEMMIISSIVCAFVGHFLNSSKYAVGGPNSATSILIAVAVVPFAPQMSDLYIGYVATLALFVGLWQLAFCTLFARFHITDYFGREVIEGLVVGIGIIFILATFYMMLGLPQLSYDQWIIFDVISLIDSTIHGEGSYSAVLLSAITIGSGIIIRFTHLRKHAVIISLLIGFSAFIILEKITSLDFNIEKVGWIHLSLATSLPDFRQVSFPVLANLIIPAFIIAIISTLQAITVIRGVRSDTEDANPLRDIFSQGIQHIFLSLLHGAPVANSINKSVTKKELGAGSRSLIYSAAFTIILVVFFDFVIAYIPLAILGSILFLSGLSMVSLTKIKRYVFSTRKTAVMFLATIFMVVVVDIYTAVVFAVLASFIINIIVSKVNISSTVTKDVLTVVVSGSILAHSYHRIQRYFNQVYTRNIKKIIFDISNTVIYGDNIIDFEWITLYEKKGIEVVILYNKNAEESLQDLIKLHPEIAQFNFQPA